MGCQDVLAVGGQIDKRKPQEMPAPTLATETSRLSVMSSNSANSLQMAMEFAHARATCKPCAYFRVKADGCRKGDACPFCHICEKEEVKKRQKESKKSLKKMNLSDEAIG